MAASAAVSSQLARCAPKMIAGLPSSRSAMTCSMPTVLDRAARSGAPDRSRRRDRGERRIRPSRGRDCPRRRRGSRRAPPGSSPGRRPRDWPRPILCSCRKRPTLAHEVAGEARGALAGRRRRDGREEDAHQPGDARAGDRAAEFWMRAGRSLSCFARPPRFPARSAPVDRGRALARLALPRPAAALARLAPAAAGGAFLRGLPRSQRHDDLAEDVARFQARQRGVDLVERR